MRSDVLLMSVQGNGHSHTRIGTSLLDTAHATCVPVKAPGAMRVYELLVGPARERARERESERERARERESERERERERERENGVIEKGRWKRQTQRKRP